MGGHVGKKSHVIKAVEVLSRPKAAWGGSWHFDRISRSMAMAIVGMSLINDVMARRL